jgi:hypothetical protein
MPENYTGNEGTDAAAAGLSVMDGTEDRRLGYLAINKTRDMLVKRVFGTAQIADKAVTVAKVDTYTDPSDGANKIPRYNSTGKLATNDPTAALHAANKQYVDGAVGQKAERDLVDNILLGELRQEVWNRDLTGTRRSVWMSAPAGGYLELGWASSSRTKKENIRDHDITDEQVLAARLVAFDRINGGPEVGGIAEEFAEAGFDWLVYRDEEGVVEGIEYSMIGIALLPVVQRLVTRVADLEKRLDELEAQ